ncbi:hypothetical protein CC80DRAFT_535474 [Byssothecium circinans]|uniref:Allergen n=1 Tax=Byssothecium circinans TaxID=147558 RepID=A0A6A5TT10_9PLEO|nr:hypothetical protein CC80DRAFT_535474 [Byssothecium circinans]
MDKAKAAVSDFMHKSGKHDTTVHETVAPAVQHETVKPHEHENVTTAVDKEIHQDHYHRTVQPVQDREVLPEKHDVKLGAVQHRDFDHRDHEATKKNLAAEQAGFKDERIVQGETHSQSAAPTVGGEHVHHHIHETIQPVVQKETIQPHVTHTTIPIHETHHNAAQHHEPTQLAAMTMAEFKNKGGALHGREERYDGFEGEPKHIGGRLKDMMHGKTSKHDSGNDHGLHEASKHGDFDPLDGKTGTSHNVGSGATSRGIDGVGATDTRAGGPVGGHKEGNGLHQTTSDQSKPGLMKKLNPFADGDGDGKKGFMD